MPRHFQKVMQSPYFIMDKTGIQRCPCFKCKLEAFFIKFFEKKEK